MVFSAASGLVWSLARSRVPVATGVESIPLEPDQRSDLRREAPSVALLTFTLLALQESADRDTDPFFLLTSKSSVINKYALSN